MGSGNGFADGLARCTLIFLNTIFFLCGGVILSFGIIALANPALILNLFSMIPNLNYIQYYVNLTQAFLNNGILLTCIGGVIVAMAVVGCVGAAKRHNRAIIIYIAFVLMLILFELAVIMWAAIEREQIHMRFADLMYSALTQNFQPIQTIVNNVVIYSNSTAALAWEDLQFSYSCCGARNYTDYQSFTWNNTITANGVVYSHAVVPPSCCLQASLYYLPAPSTSTYFVNLPICFHGPTTSKLARVVTIFVILLSIGAMKHIVKR